MVYFLKDETTGTVAGINDRGELFLGNRGSGYNLPDSPRNRAYIERDFVRYTGKTIAYGKAWSERGNENKKKGEKNV